jgi:hypothetical protein
MEMRFIPLISAGLLLSLITPTAEASLTVGVADGKDIVYSSGTNVSWTADANLLATMMSAQGFNTVVNAIISASPIVYDTPNYFDGSYNHYVSYSGSYTISTSDFGTTGTVTWLPTTPDSDSSGGFNKTNSQMGELFYNELGGIAGNSIPNSNYFSNVQAYLYWSSTEYSSDPKYMYSWLFNTFTGNQGATFKSYQYYAWAVSPGNIAAVPVPSALLLFGTGLLGLLSLKRRGNIG